MSNDAGSARAPGSPEEFVAALESLLGPEYQFRVVESSDDDAFQIHCSHGGRGQDIDVRTSLLREGTLDDVSHVAERIRIAIGP